MLEATRTTLVRTANLIIPWHQNKECDHVFTVARMTSRKDRGRKSYVAGLRDRDERICGYSPVCHHAPERFQVQDAVVPTQPPGCSGYERGEREREREIKGSTQFSVSTFIGRCLAYGSGRVGAASLAKNEPVLLLSWYHLL